MATYSLGNQYEQIMPRAVMLYRIEPNLLLFVFLRPLQPISGSTVLIDIHEKQNIERLSR